MDRNGYLHIQSWMVTDYNLRGNELLVFAVIYGFCQDGVSVYQGGQKYLMEWLGCTKPTLNRILASLCERGLLTKYEGKNNGVPFAYYGMGSKIPLPLVKNLNEGGSKEILPLVKNLNEGSKEILHNNKIDNKYKEKDKETISKDIVKKEKESGEEQPVLFEVEKRRKVAPKEEKKHYGEFVTLTEKEYNSLIERYGKADADAMIEILDNYKGSKGAKYRSDYRAILLWVHKRLEEDRQRDNKNNERYGKRTIQSDFIELQRVPKGKDYGETKIF